MEQWIPSGILHNTPTWGLNGRAAAVSRTMLEGIAGGASGITGGASGGMRKGEKSFAPTWVREIGASDLNGCAVA